MYNNNAIYAPIFDDRPCLTIEVKYPNKTPLWSGVAKKILNDKNNRQRSRLRQKDFFLKFLAFKIFMIDILFVGGGDPWYF